MKPAATWNRFMRQKEPFCTSRRTSFCTKKSLETQGFFKLRMMGLEPIRSHLRKILSLVRLPFRHIRLYSGTFSAPEQKYITIDFLTWQVFFNFLSIFFQCQNNQMLQSNLLGVPHDESSVHFHLLSAIILHVLAFHYSCIP